MRALRICILTETYHPVVGGGETQARSLARGLRRAGFEVLVVTRRSSAALPKRELVDDVPVIRVPPTGRGLSKKWALLLTTFPTLVRRRHEYGLIYVSGFRILGVPALLASKLLRKKCVLKADSTGELSGTYHAQGLEKLGLKVSSPPVRLALAARNRLLRRADSFVAMSSDIRAELMAEGVDPAAITVIPNSVDAEKFRPADDSAKRDLRLVLDLPPDATIVTFTGRLVSYKGLPSLVRVWKKLHGQHPGALLLLVGGRSLDMHDCDAELRRFVADHSLQDAVRFTGNVSNVADHLRASDVFVLPTRDEAFGISLIEAMSCGLPAVSTPVGGIKDILIDGENGLLVDPESEAALADALDRLLSDSGLRKALGAAARNTVLSRYALDTVLSKFVQHFQNHLEAERGCA